MNVRIFSVIFAAVLGASAYGQGQPGADSRLRDALRETSTQLKSAQAELATLRAEQAVLQQERDEALAKWAALQKQLSAEVATLEKGTKALKADLADKTLALERLKQELDAERATLAAEKAQLAEVQKKKDELALDQSQTLTRLADLQAKNLKLFFLSREILERYERHSLGKALAAKEPFIGQARTRLETLIQGYRDSIETNLAKQ